METEVRKRKLLSFQDAIMFQEQVINKWKPLTEVWPFAFGDDFISCVTTLGSIFITHFFRKELKIRPYATLTCYLPVVGPTAICSKIFHSYIITTDILQANACPLCITTKAVLAQAFIGIGVPLVMAPTVCFYMADRLLTYPVPPLLKAPKECLLLLRKLLQKNPRLFFAVGAIQIITTSFISYQKQKTLIDLDIKLNKKYLH